MSEEKDLEQFKQQFVEGYIDPYFDRLLDLRNAIKKAESFDEIRDLMEKEQDFLRREFGLVKAEEKNEDTAK